MDCITQAERIIKEVEVFACDQINKPPTSVYSYHNLDHTRAVVRNAKEIGKNMGLHEKEMCIVIISAWFHDIGYTINYEDHEDKGIEIARNFLTQLNIKPYAIDLICGCIEATKMPQNPLNKLEMIVCDADMYHLSEDDLIETTNNLRMEINQVKGLDLGEKDYLLGTFRLLKKQRYFTRYAIEMLEAGKVKNLQKLAAFFSKS
jgi:HD superfamily phosphodiesterase